MNSRKRGYIVKQAAEQKSLGWLISLIVVPETGLHSQRSSTIGPYDKSTIRGFGRRPGVVFLNEFGHFNGFVHDVAVGKVLTAQPLTPSSCSSDDNQIIGGPWSHIPSYLPRSEGKNRGAAWSICFSGLLANFSAGVEPLVISATSLSLPQEQSLVWKHSWWSRAIV